MKLYIVTSAIAICSLTSGCVVGRRTVGLNVPPAATSMGSKGDAYIAEVVDHRTFENQPNDPSTPSIDGDVGALSAEQKSTMIGRQRNGFGKAMGDIALPDGQSVPQQVRGLVEFALKARGYNISSNASAATKLNVSIDQFWAWFTPGMFSVTFEARVYCALTLTKDGKTTQLMVQGYGKNPGQVASDANWREAYDRAYKDFLDKLGIELEKSGF
jgi:hypothetical protein